ncbi:MAG: hypothetical protein EBS66_16915 [Betaproteobacteria bacterium]|nr:hypothetical protein [Betaproteobacteria bacterium]
MIAVACKRKSCTLQMPHRIRESMKRVTFVLAKHESGWKIVHFHHSAMPT